MPKETRRERLDRQQQRQEFEASGVPVAVPPPPRTEPQGTSWTGVFGSVLAIAVLAVIGAAFLADDKTLEGVAFALLALLFIPGFAASIADTPRRNAVLRAETALCLAIALLGGIVDFGIPIVMALPTIVLAQSAGLVFNKDG